MGSDSIRTKTNAELNELIKECEEKYQKLLKVANKLADEMDNLSMLYNEANDEIKIRQVVKP